MAQKRAALNAALSTTSTNIQDSPKICHFLLKEKKKEKKDIILFSRNAHSRELHRNDLNTFLNFFLKKILVTLTLNWFSEWPNDILLFIIHFFYKQYILSVMFQIFKSYG